jgi:hypothetical protein
LLVGFDKKEISIASADVHFRGLGRPEVIGDQAAHALYDYDVVVIHPKSYSHFIFGYGGPYSDSPKELWQLKAQKDHFDLDTVFSFTERESELKAALKGGTRVIWLMVPDKRIHFFGWRSLYRGYASTHAYDAAYTLDVMAKRSRKLEVLPAGQAFETYFEHLQLNGWVGCMPNRLAEGKALAQTPDGHSLGFELSIDGSKAWLVTAPALATDIICLIGDALKVKKDDLASPSHEGLFLCHASEDKEFVRKLKRSLEHKGVSKVWIDEGELLVGDSLLQKIQNGIELTKYFGVVLSPAAMQSKWVRRELEMAMDKETESDDVVVLPLLYKPCDLPRFLRARLYADFTSPLHYQNSIDKLLRRLRGT